MRPAQRLTRLPPYLFAELDRRRDEARAAGADVIDLGVGDPDIPPPEELHRQLERSLTCPDHHRYPSYQGGPVFRQAVAGYYRRRFGVELDPETEVLALIGSKEGIFNLSLALVNPGDPVLVPDPGYPVYSGGAIMAGGRPVPVPMGPGQSPLPDVRRIDPQVSGAAPLLFVNTPCNPTGRTARPEEMADLVEFARERDILLAHDAAYAEIVFSGEPRSLLELSGAREVALEFGSVSKTFGMAGWRLGWAVGRAEALALLGRVKTNMDSGAFTALQEVAAGALDRASELVIPMREAYRQRLEALVEPLRGAGWPVEMPQGTFYLWVACPEGMDSRSFAGDLLGRCSVVATPGVGFGAAGEGFVRFSATAPLDRLQEAARRLSDATGSWSW